MGHRWEANDSSSEWDYFAQPEDRCHSDLIESPAPSGNTSLVQEGHHDNKSVIREFGINENKNEMKQVRVAGAEAYGNRRKELVMVKRSPERGFPRRCRS